MMVWPRKIFRGRLNRLGILAVTVLFLLPLACLPDRAEADSSAVRFRTVEQSWDDLSAIERERALKNFRRFQQLPKERKRDLQDAYDRWQQLPAAERERIQQNYERYRDMNSDEKEEFRQKYHHWRSQQR